MIQSLSLLAYLSCNIQICISRPLFKQDYITSHIVDMLCLVAQACLTLYNPMDCGLSGSSVHGDSLGNNTGVDFHALFQGIFPTQRSNPGLLHCRQILYCLSHQGKLTKQWPHYSRQPVLLLELLNLNFIHMELAEIHHIQFNCSSQY